MNIIKHFVNGKKFLGDSNRTSKVFNPATGEQSAEVKLASTKDMSEAIESAKTAFISWSKKPPLQRARVVFKFKEIIEKNFEELTRIIVSEHGKVFDDAKGEITRGLEVVEFACGIPQLLKGEFTENVGTDVDSWSLRQPLGVCAGITPFNFPLNLVCHKVGPALAAGNAIIIKPASDTPLSALKLTEIFVDAGLPEEAIQCVTGSGGVIGDAIRSNPKVRKISFTGSRDVGEHICQVAGLKKVTMELGSNAPLIIMPDADLEKVAAATVSYAALALTARCPNDYNARGQPGRAGRICRASRSACWT